MPAALGEISMALGETRRIRFRLRRRTSGAFLNVNMASSIALEANLKHEVPVTPLIADRDSGDDDWTAGLVTFLISPSDVTARMGTYAYNVIVYGFEGDEDPVFDGGIIEVEHRTSLRVFGGASHSWYAPRVLYAPAASNIAPGMPVQVSGTGKDVRAAPATTRVDGVAVVGASGEYAALYGESGWVEQPSWLAVAGTEFLDIGATYYLNGPGTIGLAGSVRAGFATSATRLTFPG